MIDEKMFATGMDVRASLFDVNDAALSSTERPVSPRMLRISLFAVALAPLTLSLALLVRG